MYILNTSTVSDSFFKSFEKSFDLLTFFVPDLLKPVWITFLIIAFVFGTIKIAKIFSPLS